MAGCKRQKVSLEFPREKARRQPRQRRRNTEASPYFVHVVGQRHEECRADRDPTSLGDPEQNHEDGEAGRARRSDHAERENSDSDRERDGRVEDAASVSDETRPDPREEGEGVDDRERVGCEGGVGRVLPREGHDVEQRDEARRVDAKHAEHDDPGCRIAHDSEQDRLEWRFRDRVEVGCRAGEDFARPDGQVGDEEERQHEEPGGANGGRESTLLEQLAEEYRKDDGSDGGPARRDADHKRAFPTEVGSQDRKARGEHESQAQAHADALAEEDLPVRLGERKGKDADEPADGPDRELVPEPALVEEDAGVEGRRECKEEVAVGKESGRRSPNFVRGVTHRLPIQEMSELV